VTDEVQPLEAETTAIDGLWIVQQKQITESRGGITELFRRSDLLAAGIPTLGSWEQVNLTRSVYGAVRGLHGEAMTKLVSIVSGAAFGAYLDARTTSPTRGACVTVELVPGTAVLVPQGVCNGFQTTSREGSLYLYCFDAEWQPGMAGPAVHPLDPDLAIPWPVPVSPHDRTALSAKDAGLPSAAEVLGPSGSRAAQT
jgi:dTDP-4-dehydrorhamnose 3,5-epimerase